MNKKERKRQIKRLFNSSHANEDEDFIANQKKQLEWLKELSENDTDFFQWLPKVHLRKQLACLWCFLVGFG